MSDEDVSKDTMKLVEGFLKVIEDTNPLWNALPTAYARMVVSHFIEQAMLDNNLTFQRLNKDLFAFNAYLSNLAGLAVEKFAQEGQHE